MSSPSSHDQDYIEFKAKLDTLRYQHAVVNCGQILLLLVLKTLICGDISNIIECLKTALGSNTQYKNSFTKEEQQLLKEGKHDTWDICLLYKVLQRACGLQLGDNIAASTSSLEPLITKVKELRNELVHNFELVISSVELDNLLEELADLARKIISALVDYAQQQGKELSTKESEEIMNEVVKITDDVKREINEDESDEEDEYESDNKQSNNINSDAVAKKIKTIDPKKKMYFNVLKEKFWARAGQGNIE